jgi:hypothetical protein
VKQLDLTKVRFGACHPAEEPALSYVREAHTRPDGLGPWVGGAQALLGEAPRSHVAAKGRSVTPERQPDLGDLVLVLLASTLAGLRDRLIEDGFESSGEIVADLVELLDDYISSVAA